MSSCSLVVTGSPPFLRISAGILSEPGDLPLCSWQTASCTSSMVGASMETKGGFAGCSVTGKVRLSHSISSVLFSKSEKCSLHRSATSCFSVRTVSPSLASICGLVCEWKDRTVHGYSHIVA